MLQRAIHADNGDTTCKLRSRISLSTSPCRRLLVLPAAVAIKLPFHYSDVIMNAMASQYAGSSIVSSTAYSGADQRKHQSSASLAFVRGIHRSPADSPHKGPITRKMFPFEDVIMSAPTWSKIYGYRNICRFYDLRLFYIGNAADDLATYGASTSTAWYLLTYFSWNIPVLTQKSRKCLRFSVSVCTRFCVQV